MRRRDLGLWYRLAIGVLRPPMMVLTKRDWRGAEHLPREGGLIVAVNHLSYFDPLVVAHFLVDHGRYPRYLAKASLWRLPVLGRLLDGTAQIPVHRGTKDISAAYRDAVAAVDRGECVVFYPEGTVTRDPDRWPMVGMTGVARVALSTGAPVVPVAQWGSETVLRYGNKLPRLLPRKTMRVNAGPPVDLTGFAVGALDRASLSAATEDIMAAITRLLEEIRAQKAPEERFDPRAADVKGDRPGQGGDEGQSNGRDERGQP